MQFGFFSDDDIDYLLIEILLFFYDKGFILIMPKDYLKRNHFISKNFSVHLNLSLIIFALNIKFKSNEKICFLADGSSDSFKF